MASLAFTKSKKRTRTDDDSDSDTDNELFLTKDNWPRFIVVKFASEELPLSKTVSLCGAEGFPGNSRNPQEHQEVKRWILPSGVFEENPGRESAENSSLC